VWALSGYLPDNIFHTRADINFKAALLMAGEMGRGFQSTILQ
jgi:hypothetical protein